MKYRNDKLDKMNEVDLVVFGKLQLPFLLLYVFSHLWDKESHFKIKLEAIKTKSKHSQSWQW